MTTREWKVGDKVFDTTNDPPLACVVSSIEGDLYRIDYVERRGLRGLAYAHELSARSGLHTQEIDAIERDMADLFARMRAVIERLK